MDITIRPEAADDFDAIDRVVEEAFGTAAEAELVRKIRASSLYREESALVAVSADAVVGHVMISGCPLVGQARSGVVAMLSPLAVAPEQQHNGIGDQLVRAACAVADSAGEQLVVLQGDPAYYRRFGFEPSMPLGITMELPSWAPPEAGQVLKLSSWDASLTGHLELPGAFDGVE